MLDKALHEVLQGIDNASTSAGRPPARLLAVSKTRDPVEISVLAKGLQETCQERAPAFGENYVQEAAGKIAELKPWGIEWHLIGHLQSNKAAQAAVVFDWIQTIDRPKLIALLARHRPPERPPLNLLIQVNIDDEDSKHGCTPARIADLADRIAQEPRLRLRGLMAIPAPHPDPQQRRAAFAAMEELQRELAAAHSSVDTLSMGMSDDYALAIAEGATLVRVGTALFGPRNRS